MINIKIFVKHEQLSVNFVTLRFVLLKTILGKADDLLLQIRHKQRLTFHVHWLAGVN